MYKFIKKVGIGMEGIKRLAEMLEGQKKINI